MFTLNSEFKKIMSKLAILISIFILINSLLFIYLRDYTVAYRSLRNKAQVLFSLYPNSKIIIGGDSIAESGIDPKLLSAKYSGVNIATPAGGIQGFRKALFKYSKNKIDQNNILIINISVLSLNDEVINKEHFIGQIDGFFSEGVNYLIKRWRKDFFKNLFTSYQCAFTSCPYFSDSPYPELEKSNHKGFIPLRTQNGKPNSLDERKAMFKNYEPYFKDFVLEGVLFKGFKDELKILSQTGAKIFIILPPHMDALQKFIDSFGPDTKIQNFISHAKIECEASVKNCFFLDYYNWDHRKMPGSDLENFYDYIHFSPVGGKNFSLMIKKDIETKLKGSIL